MKSSDRREFLRLAALGAGVVLARRAFGAPAKRRLKILILGGTGFLGPHIVEAAVARGHTMTLFNRGKTNPGLFPALEKLRGDRKTDLGSLAGREWDAVVDTSGYFPADVARSAELLAPRVRQYLFVSTISVYAKLDQAGMDESAPLARTENPDATEITGENYGALKALCERAAEAAMPGKVTNVRPGLIVGPGDPTDRFTYWPARFLRGGDVLAPGTPDDPTQFIDARDLAAFVVSCLEGRTVGVFNADAQAGSLSLGHVFEACRKAATTESSTTWVPAPFLEQHKVGPWQDLPLWIPARGDDAGFGRVSAAKAQAAGLNYRPLEETIADTLAWFKTLPEERRSKLRAGLTPEREAEVLSAWRAHAASDAG
jgi:2'-hydroxyisoflavone reductase